ncbi:Flp pilus assembly protein TadD, contains TPR repeats [Marinobacter daqiaonensis]|uniref:Flp pilus assembly protein TadD, contains TPR repeats n=1 Tax=Marinobacter daqiaonensis TaxID=650891 RepID=A0A1I6J658_9GAMM|nr:tetratricopeptide repeat protein [Marinobacter daqiaonensis]SFR74431.1 Flp pilus assembly protein TadD, contains TPR repeats [Marinobacter daqiaonensis]
MPRKALFLAIGLLAFTGCASLSQNEVETTRPASDEPSVDKVTPVASEPPPTESFRPEELYLLLVGEIAAQRGQYDVTLGNYVEAAKQTRDPGVIRRALLIAESLNSESALRTLTQTWIDVAPDSQAAHRASAIQSLRDGRLEDTLRHLEEIVRLGGDADFDSLAAMGSRLPMEQQQELLRLFEELQARYPDNPEIRYSHALLQHITGQPQKALDTLEPLLDQERDFQPALVLYGELLHETGRTDKALRHLQTSSRRYPENQQLGILYARMLVSENEFRAAQDEFSRLVERFPNNHGLRLSWALVALENDELELARTQLRQLAEQGQHSNQALYYLGQIAEQEGDTDRAITLYEQVTGGSHYFTALSRAAQLRADTGDSMSAVEHLRAIRQESPEDAASLWLIEVNLLQEEGLYDLALESANQALAEHPGNQSLLYARAMIHERLGSIDQAEADLRAMIEKQPEDPTALNALGYILTVNTDRLEEARQYIEEALAMDPDSPAILDSMGWVLYRQGDAEGALDYLRRAYEIYPDPEIAAHYGEVLWSLGQESQARVVWRRALDDDPDHELLLETLDRLGVDDL